MRPDIRLIVLVGAVCALTLASPTSAEAQGRGRSNVQSTASSPTLEASVSISVGDREVIRQYYAEHAHGGLEALPPGIRRNLERGKPIPPGIAKRTPPQELRSRIMVPERFEMVEVGLDVFLVEVATGIIHDVLMDVIR